MTITNLAGLSIVALFLVLLLLFALTGRKKPRLPLRPIPAFGRLWRTIGLAVEDGTRLHFSLGRGAVNAPESASAFVGLRMVQRIMRTVSISDRHPVVTSGEGALNILSRDTLQTSYKSLGQGGQYRPSAGRLTGITPFSFAAGILPVIADEEVSANVLLGHFGPEVALILEAGERKNNLTLAGSDHLTGQAVLYAAAQEPLIGEEIYAGGAYLNVGLSHTASLQAQDVLRWFLILFILGGAVLHFLGLGYLLPIG